MAKKRARHSAELKREVCELVLSDQKTVPEVCALVLPSGRHRLVLAPRRRCCHRGPYASRPRRSRAQVCRRDTSTPRGLIVHSDRGFQYGSRRYRRELAKMGARQSMSATGSCFDNAVAESFFSMLKQELVCRYSWQTQAHASQAITEYLTSFYNPAR